MKHTLLLLLISLSCFAQPRDNEPLPYFATKATTKLNSGIYGWSKSLDGQWVSEKNLIPVQKVARGEYPEDKTSFLGIDNFEELQLIPVVYKGDTMITLVKFMKIGAYEYANTQRGWDIRTDAHYYLFTADNVARVKNLRDQVTQVIKVQLVAEGHLSDVNTGNISSELEKDVVIQPNFKRELILTAKTLNVKDEKSKDDKMKRIIRFQFHSQHLQTDELKGVLQDFKINGSSFYGMEELLDHLYYECDWTLYDQFFTLTKDFKIHK